ncbi:MAG: hypothetical protein KA113_15470 [Syntrophaceae bacterium]|nr:hypothetical protein [Syntrophaceae bacterium]
MPRFRSKNLAVLAALLFPRVHSGGGGAADIGPLPVVPYFGASKLLEKRGADKYRNKGLMPFQNAGGPHTLPGQWTGRSIRFYGLGRRQWRRSGLFIKPMDHEIDIEDLLESPALRSGVYGLWLRVFVLSVKEIRRGYGDTAAQAFLYDPENEFFDYVSEFLGYEPAAMRERIVSTLKKKRGNY